MEYESGTRVPMGNGFGQWDLTNIPEDRDPRRFYHLPEIWQAREATMAVLSICRDMLS